ncbi:MAG: aldo/keto reductase [Anaerolineales bacterium]
MLTDISSYVYGTTRLGDGNIPFEERVQVARAAMDSGVWFHTSHTYGDALKVLRTAFDEDRTKVPKLIVKTGWNKVDELRDVIRQNIEPLGLDGLEVGQLCLSGDFAKDFENGGKCYKLFTDLKKEGLVKRFVLEVFPWTSQTALNALRGGHSQSILDGYIFYLNPLQRFASNELWDLLIDRKETIVAMRTVSGGDVHRLRDVPAAAWKPYLQERATEVAPIFERSGVASWSEFCVRFAHSFTQVVATVGATSHTDRLKEFLHAAKNIQPLPEDIMLEIMALHRRWSDEVDMKAELWSM